MGDSISCRPAPLPCGCQGRLLCVSSDKLCRCTHLTLMRKTWTICIWYTK